MLAARSGSECVDPVGVARLVALATIAALSAFAVGCKRTAATGGQPASLLREGEIEALEARVMAGVAENQRRTCPRPLLRGAAIEGTAEADILALFGAEQAACFARAKQLAEQVTNAIRGPAVTSGDAQIRLRPATALADAESPAAAVAELERACAGLRSALTRAVGHQDSCSPFLPGRNAQRNLINVVHASRAASVLARKAAREGRVVEGVEILLDALRFTQDLARGPTSFIEPMLAVSGARMVLPDLILFLDSAKLDLDDLRRIAAELGALAASEEHFHAYLAAHGVEMPLNVIMPMLEPADWVPPGGFADGIDPRQDDPEASFGPLPKGMSPELRKQGNALAWVAAERMGGRWTTACPADSRYRACYDGLAELARETAKRLRDTGRSSLDVLALKPEEIGPETRKLMIDVFEGTLASVPLKYVRHHALRSAYLLALRVRVASRIAELTGGSCPDTSAFGESILGDDLEVETVDGGRVVSLSAPGWIAKEQNSAADREILRFGCTPQPAPAATAR